MAKHGKEPPDRGSIPCRWASLGLHREKKRSDTGVVLMIITIYGIIVFQLVERIAITEKSIKAVSRKCSCMLWFSYNAIPSRHEVHGKPYLQEE